MPIHDRIFRGLSKGLEVLGGFAGDIFGQVAQQVPGAIVGGLFGGAPTTIPTGFNPAPGAQADLNALFGRLGRGPQQRTFPGVPGPAQPLGGAVSFAQQTGVPMALPVSALPGGAPVMQAGFGDVFGGLLGQAFGGGGALTPMGAACPQLFTQAPQTLRAVRSFHITNPSTGKEVFFRNVGQPILFSGDLTVCKRVEKVARRARRASGRKR